MLNPDFSKLSHPIVILIRGLPGSGKSYIVRELLRHIAPNSVVSLDPDKIDFVSHEYHELVESATAEGVDPALFPYRFLRAKAYRGITKNKLVIWNQPFTNLEIFQKMTNHFEEVAQENDTKLSILVIEVNVDPEIARRRMATRRDAGGHGPLDERFNRHVQDYQTFAKDGYQVESVNGTDPAAASAKKIISAIEKLV